ncbi:hypothetical protein ABG067_002182 [Albugo candida]
MIPSSLVEQLFRREWQAQDMTRDGRTSDHSLQISKIQQDTLRMSAEFLKLFLIEALHRAQMEAMMEDAATVEPHHIEQILAQLLLDF